LEAELHPGLGRGQDVGAGAVDDPAFDDGCPDEPDAGQQDLVGRVGEPVSAQLDLTVHLEGDGR
jgi:hypothetical protein